ncbi:aminodeoxychorismate synthase component I [Sphingomonas sp. 28-63-12]|uniref:aminodeoxychorismate synthase component I n=1 Tax=Sphingomonas sp. 28-63-12 TaxID=1970434 RepID=UPI000BC48BB0|nr:MAG: aminodeoxychorismate synthase, component I [Sphingomonas sp. 28-63-12]
MADFTPPFVLLDDARPGGAPARLYRQPTEVFAAERITDVLPTLAAIRAGIARGQHAAGYLSYEAAPAFEPVLGERGDRLGPLLWFGLFDGFTEIAADAVNAWLPDPDGAWIGGPAPLDDRARYDAKLADVLALITAGDLYQANLTFPSVVAFEGSPLAVYAQLRARSGAGYGAIVNTGTETLLSLSPELFFAVEGGKLLCRPMKGTASRGATAAEDETIVTNLANDPKQRAENLMIVDLMRNDLSRVAVPGSVAVPSLFAVESYPTIHQLVSTVTADLAPGKDAIDVMAALFPCGSITGAPKIRAMQAIAAIENAPRGPYTGAIGRFDAAGASGRGDAMFNVAIRTLMIRGGDATALFGAGGGIVADSGADEEWEEARAKGAFLMTGHPGFDLIETMAFHPESGIALLDRHLTRMKASANRFGFAFDRHAARNELQAATFRLGQPSRVRLLLAPSGAIAIESAAMPAAPAAPVAVSIMPLPVDPADFRLRHKTSDRGFYDAARAASGQFEVLFQGPDGLITEGSFTSLFVPRDQRLVTPSLAKSGLLPGVLRAELIARGKAIEGNVTPDDLAMPFFIGNALRGLIPAKLVAPQQSPAL